MRKIQLCFWTEYHWGRGQFSFIRLEWGTVEYKNHTNYPDDKLEIYTEYYIIGVLFGLGMKIYIRRRGY